MCKRIDKPGSGAQPAGSVGDRRPAGPAAPAVVAVAVTATATATVTIQGSGGGDDTDTCRGGGSGARGASSDGGSGDGGGTKVSERKVHTGAQNGATPTAGRRS